MSARPKFSFTIRDLALFLGKAPVTLRGWERQGLISFPRNGRGDRRFSLESLRQISESAVVRERCDQRTLNAFCAAIAILEIVENS